MNARDSAEAVRAYGLVHEASGMLAELARDPSNSAKQKEVQGRNLAKAQSAMKTLRSAHPAVEAAALVAEAAARSGVVLKRCKAVHAWDAAAGAGDGDLVFSTGDEFELVSEEQPGHGWMTGRRGGVEGIFPGNYVEVFEAPGPQPAAPVAAPAAALPAVAEVSASAEAEMSSPTAFLGGAQPILSLRFVTPAFCVAHCRRVFWSR